MRGACAGVPFDLKTNTDSDACKYESGRVLPPIPFGRVSRPGEAMSLPSAIGAPLKPKRADRRFFRLVPLTVKTAGDERQVQSSGVSRACQIPFAPARPGEMTGAPRPRTGRGSDSQSHALTGRGDAASFFWSRAAGTRRRIVIFSRGEQLIDFNEILTLFPRRTEAIIALVRRRASIRRVVDGKLRGGTIDVECAGGWENYATARRNSRLKIYQPSLTLINYCLIVH